MTEHVYIDVGDGVRLAATLYLPEQLPAPVILEALPYRKDDLTAHYRPEYRRLRDEHGYAICRVDLRGTGSSTGIATDEYPPSELDDLRAVIAWLADRSWCTGAVGMYGTSYSGFNSLQVAATRPPALRAIIAIYATDDRYTDDVHYRGGVKKALDVVDYEAYMVAMNALPPVPAMFGEGWRDEWAERVERTEPWIINWLRHPLDGDYWRHGSLRPDYGRIVAATLLIGGWADGYRNNSLRTMAALTCPKKLLMGPWSHMSTATSRPGPRIDSVPIMARWWDRWLRDERNGVDTEARITWFARRSSRLSPVLDDVEGAWRTEQAWPLPPERAATWRRGLGHGTETLTVQADVGAAAGIDCAGHLPYGQPTDQRSDDARSITTDWVVDAEPVEVLGHGHARLRIRTTTAVCFVAVKLCDVAPGGWSSLVARGFVNPSPWVPGEWRDVDVELEATSWRFEPGHRVRVTVAGTDWPNLVPPPVETALELDRDALEHRATPHRGRW